MKIPYALLRSLFVIGAVLIIGCEGPVGPEGPTGPTGPQGERGEQGDNVFLVLEQQLSDLDFTDDGNVRTAMFDFPELTADLLATSAVLSYFVVDPSIWLMPARVGVPGQAWTLSTRYVAGQVIVSIHKDFDDPNNTTQFSVNGTSLKVVVLK